MRIETLDISGNIHEAARACNFMGIVPWVLGIEYVDGNTSTVILRTTDYPAYVHLCGKLGREPLSTAQWFAGAS